MRFFDSKKLIQGILITLYLCCILSQMVRSKYIKINSNNNNNNLDENYLRTKSELETLKYVNSVHQRTSISKISNILNDKSHHTNHRHRHHHYLSSDKLVNTFLDNKHKSSYSLPLTDTNKLTHNSQMVTMKPVPAFLLSTPSPSSTSSSSSSSSSSLSSSLTPPLNPSSNIFSSPSKVYILYNRCSGGHIEIFGKSVSANSQENSPYALMLLESQPYGHPVKFGVRILGQTSGAYLCFNKKGRLTTRYNGSNLGCVFNEIIGDNLHSKFESVYNPDWFIGFNSNGKAINGKIQDPRKAMRQKCFQFLKHFPD